MRMKPVSGHEFKTIVVATDLSGGDSTALRYAQAIARLHQSTLVIVHVIDPVAYAFPRRDPDSIAADEAARRELRGIEEAVRREGIPIHSVVESGVIYERILQTVVDHKGDLLVLGTRARTEIGRAALGTVARQLLTRTPCPLLTVPSDAEESLPWAGRWRRVLVAVDFSEASLAAVNCAHGIAHERLVALHIPHCAAGNKCASCIEKLRLLAPFNESHTVPVEHVLRFGDSAALIAKQARSIHADLVVLGAPASQLSEEDFPSSTILQVVSQVSCPVLCVPAARSASLRQNIEEVLFAC